jgi:formiminotetrahydrofolate cyclodeaminase
LAAALEPLLIAALKVPVNSEALVRLEARHADLQDAWKALNDTPADLAGGVIPEALKVQWDAATIKTQMAWEYMQEAVQSLRAAAAQFPASLLVASMGLKVKHGK